MVSEFEFNFVIGQLLNFLGMVPSMFAHQAGCKCIEPNPDFDWSISREYTKTSFQKFIHGEVLRAVEC